MRSPICGCPTPQPIAPTGGKSRRSSCISIPPVDRSEFVRLMRATWHAPAGSARADTSFSCVMVGPARTDAVKPRAPKGASPADMAYQGYEPDELTGQRSEEHTSELQSPDHLVC